MNRHGSVLVGVLWCVALLSVVVVGVLHSARLDLGVVKNHGDMIQAHYLALAGIEKAKALLYQDAADRKRSAKNHTGQLFDASPEFKDVLLGRGEFSIFRQGRPDELSGIVYGMSDEESRLNVNSASAEELGKLYNITPDVVAAIIDWRDGDNSAKPGGAEAEYYMSLQPPYLPRNGPFQTLRELLMVAGVSRELFLGEDANQNGLLDPEEDDGKDSSPFDNRDGLLDAGWSAMLTVDSLVQNQNAAGQDRVNIQSADEKTLAGVPGISADLAKAIVAYRNQQQLESLADLLEVTAVNPQNNPPPPQQNRNANPPPSGRPSRGTQQNTQVTTRSSSQPAGEKLISEELLLEFADDLTVNSEDEKSGLINVNTASAEVLACLPGISRELAQAVVAYRQSAGFLPNIAWLLKVDGMTRQIFKQVVPKLTVRSETFRIVSEGRVNSSGARKRLQVTIRLRPAAVQTLSYREDL